MDSQEPMVNDEQSEIQPSGVDLNDVYYVLFRHKWKIILLSLAGVLAAAGLYMIRPPAYQSEGRLLVRYVRESEARFLNPDAKDSEIKYADSRGDGIINTEKEILTSFDLALQVADHVGPEKILAKAGGGADRIQAATLILKNVLVESRKDNNTIRVVFRHPDPELLQPVLRSLFDAYQKKHVAVHALAGVNEEELTRKTDELRGKLAKTEEDLRTWKDTAGVTSVAEANKAQIDQITRIKEALHKAETELAGRRAGLKELQGPAPRNTENVVGAAKVPPEKADQYRNVAAELDSLRKTVTNLLTQFTGQSSYVKQVREQIADFEQQQSKLEEEYPQLANPTTAFSGTVNQAASPMNPLVEVYRISALEAETNTLHSQLETLLVEAAMIKKAEAKITELQRDKEMLETNLRTYQTVLEQAKISMAFAPGKMPNINVVQEPSPPAKDTSKTMKPMAIALALGVIGGLVLAFFTEFVFDRSVKRPIEVKKKLLLPLFLTIPRVARNGHARLPKGGGESPGQIAHQTTSLVGVDPSSFFAHRTGSRARKKATNLSEGSDGDVNSTSHHDAGSVAPWNASHGLRAYYEALRDRLITHFEVNNMTHKPKLIAVTSCSQGAGVTSTAAGLAATLSETGDGNVLLVDMNLDQGAAHPFHMGRPACGLLDALESETRDPALVHEKLYLASMNDAANNLPCVLPRRFTHLVPKLKMSDYDYIIFDMPAISQTSITPKLAMYMDMVLMVIESEKTNRDVLEQANTLLAESNVSVKAVLNKYRQYVPRWLHQEL